MIPIGSASTPNSAGCINDLVLSILIFKLNEVYLGIDISQIYEMVACNTIDDEEIELQYIDKLIPFRNKPVIYICPTALLINNNREDWSGRTTKYGIIIDMPIEIIEINIAQIQPLPILIEQYTKSIWAAYIKGDDIVLLLDLYKIDSLK